METSYAQGSFMVNEEDARRDVLVSMKAGLQAFSCCEYVGKRAEGKE